MLLTLQEQKTIARYTINNFGQPMSLNEARSRYDVRNEVKANIIFYEGLKNHYVKEGISTGIGWLDGVIAVFGGIKDLMTSTDIGKWIMEKIQKAANKLFPKLSEKTDDWTDKIVNFFKKIATALSPKGLAWIMAAWKNKTLRPKKQQIAEQMDKAVKIYKILMVILIGICIAKLVPMLAVSKSIAGAKISAIFSKVFSGAGLGKLAMGGFTTLSLVKKIEHFKHADHYKHEAEDIINKAKAELKQAI